MFTEINKQIFASTIERLKSGEQINIEDLNLDKQLLDKINKFAPIKHILKNKPDDDNQVIELLMIFQKIYLIMTLSLESKS